MLLEVINGSNREYLYLNGKMLAKFFPGPLTKYHFRDHLGSLRVFSERDGSRVWRHDYYPFGLERTVAPDGETYLFTPRLASGQAGQDLEDNLLGFGNA